MSTLPSTTAVVSTPARGPLPVLTAVLAVAGGAAWTTAALVHASQPEGCVGGGCSLTRMREATTATTWLVGAAAVLMLASGAGLLAAVRRAGRLGRPGVAGAALCGLGVAVLAPAVLLQETVYGGDWSGMPYLVGPGVVALAVGVCLMGWTVLRSHVVPRWAGGALMLGAVLLVAANEQTSAVLLAIPFGVAWAVTGVALALTDPGRISGDAVR